MALSERLYELRKQAGLSQEQLAERLGVSRQAVSKWETGSAVPESETLVAISTYFDVSLDYLMKDGITLPEPITGAEEPQTTASGGHERRTVGVVVCLVGVVCLLVWGIVSVFMPAAQDRIATSSMITIDGNGIFLIICLAAIIAGAVLLLRGSSNT